MLNVLYTAVSWVLLRWHQFFSFLGLNPNSGLAWALSIVFLVITARLVLFRFFIKQVHYQRRMQQMQPKIKKLQEKYKGDKAGLQREMMALQQAEGFNPITGCLPMLLQIPVFISLFHVLRHLSNSVGITNPNDPMLSLYGFTPEQTISAANAKLFGKAPLAASLHDSAEKIHALGGDVTATRVVTLVLVLISAAATLITQRASIASQPTPAEGQAALLQKLMLVGIPISVLFSGFIFPLGVLLYWFTSNLWTMGQQFYILRFHPHPDTVVANPAAPQNELGRSLAPKPGAKPINPRTRGPQALDSAEGPVDEDASMADGAAENGSGAAGNRRGSGNAAAPMGSPDGSAGTPAGSNPPAGGAPRPGAKAQRPNRPATKRTPSKKRR
jgi:YidC/Oxa1 family membrane protein insertase